MTPLDERSTPFKEIKDSQLQDEFASALERFVSGTFTRSREVHSAPLVEALDRRRDVAQPILLTVVKRYMETPRRLGEVSWAMTYFTDSLDGFDTFNKNPSLTEFRRFIASKLDTLVQKLMSKGRSPEALMADPNIRTLACQIVGFANYSSIGEQSPGLLEMVKQIADGSFQGE